MFEHSSTIGFVTQDKKSTSSPGLTCKNSIKSYIPYQEWRKKRELIFIGLCRLVTFTTLMVLALLIFHIFSAGTPWLDLQFLDSFPSRFPSKAGIKSALAGSLWLILMTASISIPIYLFFTNNYCPSRINLSIISLN